MQFTDGNRIDLSFFLLDIKHKVLNDSLSIVLLDKDNLLPPLPPSSDSDYLPQKPSAKAFADCTNEFWWVCPYVAKGLWRNEPTYALDVRETIVRPQLMKMLTWYFGIQTGFQKSPGKLGKYMREDLGEELWEELMATYSGAQPARAWNSLFRMGEIFREVAQAVAQAFGYEYPEHEDRNVTAFLGRIRAMPPDAPAIPHPGSEPLEYIEADAEWKERISAEWSELAGRHMHLADGYSLLALQGGEPVGLISVFWRALEPPLQGEHEGYIDIIEVREGFRRQGIAARLVELAEARALQHEACQLRAWSSQDKIEAIRMWQALGFGLHPAVIFPHGQEVRGYYAVKALRG
jgi:ribosomal protein S18 acetylase RimI-like enzyme